MKEVHEMVLVFSVICLALGNSLPVQYQATGKEKAKMNDETNKQEFRRIDDFFRPTSGEHSRGGNKYNLVIIPHRREDDYAADIKMFREYFGTKDRAKSTLLIIAKYFVIFYIVTGYFVGMEEEVPEVLFGVGILCMILKFLL